MSFIVTTYNVLATSYIKPEYYLNTPRQLLDPHDRIPRLVSYLERLRSDVFCLQEVEPEVFGTIQARLEPLGYSAEYAMKGQGKPDGCGVFFNARHLQLLHILRLDYQSADGDQPASGHVAQLVRLNATGHHMLVVNTHLKWDPEGRHELSHIRQLIETLAAQAATGSGLIVCGDLNSNPRSSVVRALHAAGLEYAHVACQDSATCNANQSAEMLDFIFYNNAFRGEALPIPSVMQHTPLPTLDQPSDHVPVSAVFEWRSNGKSVVDASLQVTACSTPGSLSHGPHQ
ncbi:MAG: endonuclease/exonuclease/phosphatase family protein [Verrucomicrobiota bacterium]